MDVKTKRFPALYGVFNACYAVLFAGIALLSVVWHNNPQFATKPLPMVGIAVVLGVLLAVAGAVWHKIGSEKAQRWLLRILPVVYGLFLLWFSNRTMVMGSTSWDYGDVFTAAEQYVLNRGTEAMAYFTFYGNNLPLFWAYYMLFSVLKLFGIADFMPWLVAVNSLCVLASFVLAGKAAVLLVGKKKAVFWMLLVMASPAFALYSAIAYTDTLSMPFVAGALLLWLQMRQLWQNGSKKPATVKAIAAFLLLGLGGALKISVLILGIAFLIDGFFLLRKPGQRQKDLLAVLVCGMALCVAVCVGCNKASRALLPVEIGESIPFTHWIMMGLNGNGGYSDVDYQLTLQQATYEERRQFTLEEIGRRLDAMGPAGFAKHLLNKLSYLYSDGTEWAPNTLARAPRQPQSALYDFILQERPYSGLLFYYADAWRLVILVLYALGALQDLRKKDAGRTVCRIAVFGLTLFLLMWEACSRYILNYDLLLLLTCYVPSAGLLSFVRPAKKEVAAV